MIRYSQMAREELLEEIERLRREEERARRQSMTGELDVLRQQIRFARSYLTDSATIQPGGVYDVEGETTRFRVDYLNGVMAWGTFEGSREKAAVPIGIMTPVEGTNSDE
ncbi:DUF1811 family protein [Paludifilum halophilum]|uniref:DUF1811 family protein n=1 Tax=Paludifilum halophilum TaxID=1642702 RepID=UPI0011402CAD|nr:DUF1811 family protein [Paludifilum halophilum]